jgi:hypothetical protein
MSSAMKAVCAVTPIILIAAVGFIFPGVWFWISWEIVGAVLVAVGCVGEWVLLYKNEDARHNWLEKKFAIVVAVGVTMDAIGLFHAIPEAIRLENAVADAHAKAEEFRLKADEFEARLRNADPLQRPISTVTTSINLILDMTTISQADWYRFVAGHNASGITLNLGPSVSHPVALLVCTRFNPGVVGKLFVLDMDFSLENWNVAHESLSSFTVASVTNWTVCAVNLFSLGNGTDMTIASGSGILVINSTAFEFSIPKTESIMPAAKIATFDFPIKIEGVKPPDP